MAKIRLKYVERFKDRHGHVRHYFRRGKGTRIPLPGLPGSEAFMAAYAEALHGVERLKPTQGAAGTIYALVTRYVASEEFKGKAPVTQANYRRVLDTFRTVAGDRSVAGFTATAAEGLLEQVTASNGLHPAYNLWRVLRNLMAFAKADRWRPDNPMAAVKAPKRPKLKGYRTATVADVDAYRAFYPLGTKARLAFELLLWTGARRSDIVTMGVQQISDGVLTYAPQKGGGVRELSIPVHPELQAAIDAMPRSNLTFIVTEYGAPFTPQGFTNWFKDRCRDAGLPASTSPHSLRKALLTQMADGGATAHEIQAVSGHQNIAEVQTYTRSADQKRLAKSGLEKVARRPKAEQEAPTPRLRVGKKGE